MSENLLATESTEDTQRGTEGAPHTHNCHAPSVPLCASSVLSVAKES